MLKSKFLMKVNNNVNTNDKYGNITQTIKRMDKELDNLKQIDM